MITFKQYYEAAKVVKGNYMSINVDGSILLPGFVAPKTGKEVTLDNQHVTLIYSKTSNLDPKKLLQKVESKFPPEITAQAFKFAAFDAIPKDGERDENKATMVVKIRSDMLEKIHSFLKSEGCEHSYPEYSAHVSLYYDVDRKECHRLVDYMNEKVKLPTDLRLSGYKSSYIIEDWSDKL